MATTLKVNGRDLSNYLRVAHEDGMDPGDPEFSEPQFAGVAAFQDGQAFVDDAVNNRKLTFPLHLKADSTDALYALIREINREDLRQGNEIEYRSGSAGQSSFFDLERGRLEPKFEFWLDMNKRARAVLTLWVRPYARTSGRRLIASLSGTGPMQFPVTGIVGDVEALANLEARVGSQVASSGRLIGYGIHRSASFLAWHQAVAANGQASSVLAGASGAVGSQYLGIPVSPTGASGVAYREFLTPAGGYVGRSRVFAIARSGLSAGIPIYAKDRFGAVLGPTAQATVVDIKRWQVIDLGEVQVPDRRSTQEAIPTQFVELYAGGASGYAINASRGLQLNGLLFLPLDEAPGIMRSAGADVSADLIRDTFTGGVAHSDLTNAAADTGQSWSAPASGGLLGRNSYSDGVAQAFNPVNFSFSNASGVRWIASGLANTDVQVELTIGRLGTAAIAPSASSVIDLYAKALVGTAIGPSGPNFVASQGVWARLVLGPSQMLQIWKDPGGAPTAIACAGIATTLASGLYQAQTQHRLVLRIFGGQADAWIATGALPASSAIGASNAHIALTGWAGLKMSNPSDPNALVYADNFKLSRVGASAPDAAAREWFRFESHPEVRALQGNASVFVADRGGDHRGAPPRIPPEASGQPSGPAQAVVFAGEVDNFLGNDLLNPAVEVVEQFTYLR